MITTIAEIASAHNGDYLLLLEILTALSKSDFDAVKLQVFRASALVASSVKDSPLYDIEIKENDWRYIFSYIDKLKHASAKKITFIAEPYDTESLTLCNESGVFDAVKIPTSDLLNIDFIVECARHFNNLYLGIGGATLDEIDYVMKENKPLRASSMVYIIHGFQSYPTTILDTDLWKIPFLADRYDISVGYADHTDSSIHHSSFVPSVLATAAGASFIEKHVCLSRSDQLPDYISSIELSEYDLFTKLVNDVRMLYVNNNSDYSLSINEKKYRDTMKKFGCASRNLYRGDIMTREMVSFRRVEGGHYSFKDFDEIIGKTLTSDISSGAPLTLESFN